MPDLMERIYCSEQIHIPPTFPYIMKLYCKAAIRTQPYDLLKWSAAYFRALANGEQPPAKERIEYPPYDTPTGLTPGYIKVLIKQLGKNPETIISAQTLFIKWNNVCLPEEVLIKLLALMGARTEFNWLKFVAVAAGSICNTLTQTMILVCELLTDEPEGGMATIPLDVFTELYLYLAFMECGALTEREIQEQDAIECEEDLGSIAEKIRSGDYGEVCEGFERETVAEEEEVEGDREKSGETKRSSEISKLGEEIEAQIIQGDEADLAEQEKEDEEHAVEVQPSEDVLKREEEALKEVWGSSEQVVEDVKSTESRASKEEKQETADKTVADELDKISEEKKEALTPTEEKTEKPLEAVKSETKEIAEPKPVRTINLDDLEESVRQKVEGRLGPEEGSSETSADFENLGSYLLKAEAKAKTFTADEIGFRIFKKYLRQEIPGIGPYNDKEQVEKVIDFMDYWSQKQEGMVMPRNIRHWMCPPLDKVPLSEP